MDDRQLRRSQTNQASSPSTPTQPNLTNHGRPGDTPLAAKLRDGRQIGPKPPRKPDPDQKPDADDPSFMQYSLFSAPLTQPSNHSPTEDAMPDSISQQPPETNPDMPAATAADEPSQASIATQPQYPPTTPGDLSMPSTLPVDHHQAAPDQPAAHQQRTPWEEDSRERSWQRVEKHLLEIRRLAASYGHSLTSTAGIVQC